MFSFASPGFRCVFVSPLDASSVRPLVRPSVPQSLGPYAFVKFDEITSFTDSGRRDEEERATRKERRGGRRNEEERATTRKEL